MNMMNDNILQIEGSKEDVLRALENMIDLIKFDMEKEADENIIQGTAKTWIDDKSGEKLFTIHVEGQKKRRP